MKFAFKFFSQRSRLGKDEYASRFELLTRLLRNEEGSIIVYLTLAIPVLIGVAALGTEGGFWLYQKRLLQSAADNAAYSAATAYAADKSSNITTQARAITANDYNLINGQNNVTVAVNRPPSGGCFTGTSNYTGANAIEVIVTNPRAPLLSGIWLKNNVNICGRGVAIVPGTGDCILALNSTGAAISTMNKVNNLNVTLQDCSIFSNSTSSNSITMNGNNNTMNADAIGAAGGIVLNGNAKSSIFNSSTGNPPVADPYASDAASLWHASQQTAPTVPTAPTVVTTCAGCLTGTATTTPSSTPTKCDNTHTTITIGPGNWTAAAITALALNKCTTAIKLSGGTYAFAGGVNLSTGGPLTIQAASNIIVTGGALTTGTVNFSSGNFSIYVPAGTWTSGATTFGSGNYNISIAGGGWAIGGTTTFGNGNYKVAIAGGNWAIGGATSFGNGSYDISVTGSATANTGNWTIGGNTAFGSGTYNIAVTAGSATNTGNWTINSGTNNFGTGNHSISIRGNGFTNTGNWTIGGGTNTFGGSNIIALTGGTVANTNDWNVSGGTNTFNGTYSVALTGTGTATTGNWNITVNTTIGAGIYYLSGNFNINSNGGNQTVTAGNATLVLTGATSIVDFSKNNSNLTLTAPTTGWNAGIAIWEPNSTGTNALATGNSSIVNVSGVIYAPKAVIQYVGNTGASTTCTQIVAGQVEFGGNSIHITNDLTNPACSSYPNLKVFGQIAALVE